MATFRPSPNSTVLNNKTRMYKIQTQALLSNILTDGSYYQNTQYTNIRVFVLVLDFLKKRLLTSAFSFY